MNTTTRHDDPLHAAFEDDLPAYALGILDDASATRVEEHLASCPTCREALREYQEVVRLLPLALPVSQPPADARELLLAGASGGRPSGWRRWFDKRGPRGPRTRAAVAGLAVALALLIGFAVWFSTRDDSPPDPAEVVEQLQQRDDVHVVAMTGSESAPDAVGQLIMQPRSSQAGLVASNLPTLERGHCYQLWFVRADGSRVSGGIFWEEEDGSAITLVDLPPDLANFLWLGVTEEPYPGSPTPTGENVLGGEF